MVRSTSFDIFHVTDMEVYARAHHIKCYCMHNIILHVPHVQYNVYMHIYDKWHGHIYHIYDSYIYNIIHVYHVLLQRMKQLKAHTIRPTKSNLRHILTTTTTFAHFHRIILFKHVATLPPCFNICFQPSF
jgi:hypothetical protein